MNDCTKETYDTCWCERHDGRQGICINQRDHSLGCWCCPVANKLYEAPPVKTGADTKGAAV